MDLIPLSTSIRIHPSLYFSSPSPNVLAPVVCLPFRLYLSVYTSSFPTPAMHLNLLSRLQFLRSYRYNILHNFSRVFFLGGSSFHVAFPGCSFGIVQWPHFCLFGVKRHITLYFVRRTLFARGILSS